MTRYEIDISKLDANIETVKLIAGVPVIAVVKCDGYGFGLTEFAETLFKHSIKTFAVTEIADLIKLRRALPDAEILVMRSTCIYDEAEQIVKYGGIATIGSLDSAKLFNQISAKIGVVTKCHLKIDTGFARYGFLPSQTNDIIKCFTLNNLQFTGAYSHFSSAYGNKKMTYKQYNLFINTISKVEKYKRFDMLHIANSSAVIKYNDFRLDSVRVGSLFTGRIDTESKYKFSKAGMLKTEITEIKTLPKGSYIGYNHTFKTKRTTKTAVIPIGHYDGFGLTNEFENSDITNVLLSVKNLLKHKQMYVTINSEKYRVIGKIGSTHTIVDVTGGNVKAGDTAIVDISPLKLNPDIPKIFV